MARGTSVGRRQGLLPVPAAALLLAAWIACASAAPALSATPLVQGTVIGRAVFAEGDTPHGGHGQTIDGIACNITEMLAKHNHAHLAIFFNGSEVAVPPYVGIVPKPNDQGCLYWLHTHDATGIIHIESPDSNGMYTLGEFFDIWGEPLTQHDVAGDQGMVHAFVDGMAYRGNLRTIPLGQHTEITLEVGSPVVPPPAWIFPAGL